MDESIKSEQEKLANYLNGLSAEEMEKRDFGVMCWLQGYEVGYQSAMEKKSE